MFHILHIDQSQEFNKSLSTTLCRSAHLTWAPDLSNARKLMDTEKIDLILLDISLPDGDGIDFCFSLQSRQRRTPIIVLTDHDDISKKILSFAAGADDYIIRPFHEIEFQAKLDSKLRNYSLQYNAADTLKWKELQIVKSRQEVTVFDIDGDKKLDLTVMEFKILMLFTNSLGVVLSRDSILDQVWGSDVFVSSRSVDTHISKLRKKLGHVSHIVQSVHGAGYMFCPSVSSDL